MGNRKTPGHRGFLSDLTMPVRRYGLVPGPIFDVPMAGHIEDGTSGDLGPSSGRLMIEARTRSRQQLRRPR